MQTSSSHWVGVAMGAKSPAVPQNNAMKLTRSAWANGRTRSLQLIAGVMRLLAESA